MKNIQNQLDDVMKRAVKKMVNVCANGGYEFKDTMHLMPPTILKHHKAMQGAQKKVAKLVQLWDLIKDS